MRRGGATLLFFHGWMCGSKAGPPYPHCPANFNLNRDSELGPRRAMFAARLRFTGSDRPKVRFFYAPTEMPSDRRAQTRAGARSHPDGSGPAGTIPVGLMSSCTR